MLAIDAPMHLAFKFKFDRALHKSKAVDILDFDARVEIIVAALAHRYIGVASKRALLQVTITYSEMAYEGM